MARDEHSTQYWIDRCIKTIKDIGIIMDEKASDLRETCNLLKEYGEIKLHQSVDKDLEAFRQGKEHARTNAEIADNSDGDTQECVSCNNLFDKDEIKQFTLDSKPQPMCANCIAEILI